MMVGMITLILTGLLRGVRTRRALVLENLALRHQLAVLQRTVPRPRLRRSDRLFWVKKSIRVSRLNVPHHLPPDPFGGGGSDAMPAAGSAPMLFVMGFWTFLCAVFLEPASRWTAMASRAGFGRSGPVTTAAWRDGPRHTPRRFLGCCSGNLTG
jgi:hypothetical protein